MKCVKRVGLFLAGAVGGAVFGGTAVFIAELKSKTIRTAFSKLLAAKIEEVLYGPAMDRKVTYRPIFHSYYGGDTFSFVDKVVLDERGEAEKVLDDMHEIINIYGVISVADFYDLVGVTHHYNFDNNNYGWTDIKNASIVKVRDGYMIKLPKAFPLN